MKILAQRSPGNDEFAGAATRTSAASTEVDEFADVAARNENGTTWKPKDETSGHDKVLIGWLVSRKSGQGEFLSEVYLLEDTDGNKWSVWGDTVLNSDQGIGTLPMGSYVRIEFKGSMLKKNAKPGSKKSTDYFNSWEVKDLPSKARAPQFGGSIAPRAEAVTATVAPLTVPTSKTTGAPATNTAANAGHTPPPDSDDDSLPF